MKAKTTKFLAVLAVLAMAFAAVTVLTSTTSTDAEAENSVWTFEASKKTYITLGADVITPTDGQVLADNTAYYVTEDMTLNLTKETNVDNGGILIFLKKGAEVTIVLPDDNKNVVAVGVFGVTESKNAAGETVLTLHKDYKDTAVQNNWSDASGKLSIPDTWDEVAASNGSIGHDYHNHGLEGFTASFYEGELNGSPVTYWSYTNVGINWTSAEGYFIGDNYKIQDAYCTTEPPADPQGVSTWYFVDSNAVIETYNGWEYVGPTDDDWELAPGVNKAQLTGFNGIIKMDAANGGSITVESWLSGDITVTKGTIIMGAEATIPAGSTITFLEGTTVSAAVAAADPNPAYGIFAFVDEYNDTHSFQTSAELEVGMGDFTISAGENKIIVDGTVTLTDSTKDTVYTFNGNATLSGMVYTKTIVENAEKICNLTLTNVTKDKSGADMPADIKLGTFQVTDGGAVTLVSSALVETGCSFYVSGDLTIGTEASTSEAILKIAEGAVVKPEGKLTLAAPTAATTDVAAKGGYIWNAGQFIVTNYTDANNKYFDQQLVRVFMNTSYQTGTFYLGSSVYDGTETSTATDGHQTPLTVAFGAYLDMTGIDKVNLTSGGINVNSALYKYKTLILATFDNTIALTASFDNQYPVTVSLDGKASATPVFTAKSATFRNVVWQSPISATIYVTAPEVYTVVLAKTLNETSAPYTAKDKWTATDGLTIKDQNGRVIPIAADGTIKVVFGYEYTIEGANSTSNYKFISPNKDITDLTKVSKTVGKFVMIRDNLTPNTPIVLQITEGLALELTVYLDDATKKYSVGEVFMYYNIANDAGKVIGDGTPVYLQLNDDGQKVGIIKNIYSNDVIYFKSEFVKFFKSTALATGAQNIVFPSHEEENENTGEEEIVFDNVILSPEKFEQKFTFDGITQTENKASFTLECAVNTVNVYFKFGDATTSTQRITVDFTTFCSEAGHTESVTKKKSETSQTATTTPVALDAYQFYIAMAVGEVYTVTWSPVDNYISEMTYSTTNAPAPADTDKVYDMGNEVPVKGKLYYILTEYELKYVTIENQTNYDLTINIGEFSADIASKKSNTKVIVNDDDNTLVLSKKGWTVEGWDFTISYRTEPAPAHDPATKTVHVSGPQTTETYMTYNDNTKVSVDNTIITKITITKADLTMTRYFVNVLADDHGAIDPFDQTGYMDEVRKAYVTTQYGYNVVDVIYQYQEVDDPEIVEGHATKGTTPEGQEVWTYTMPASNVLLKPIIEKETRDLSFVDQTGELIEPTQKVAPRTEVNMPVPCKPLSEIVSVTTESQIEYVYVPETGYISFVMPDEDVVFVVTCQEIDYSKDVIVTVGQKGMPITLVITALDGKQIASGTIKMNVTYTYTDEDGEISTDVVTVTKNYVAGESTVITDQEFITLLGDNYSGAFAVTGTFEFGYAVGSLSKTVYTPVLGA